MTVTDREIKVHDFRRGEVVERVTLQAIEGLCETFARTTSQKFTALLHHQCIFEISSLEQTTWGDLAQELQDGMYFFTFSMHPIPGRGIIVIPTKQVLTLVDLRLAGSGDEDFSGRVPSEIDQAFVAPLIEEMIGEFGEAIAKFKKTSPVLESQEGNILFVNLSNNADMFMAVKMEFSVAKRPREKALMCLPFEMVLAIIDSLHEKKDTGMDLNGETVAKILWTRLGKVPMDVVLQFPSVKARPRELLELKVGDVLTIGHPKDRPLEVRADGILVALGEICKSGMHKACEIKEGVYE